MQSKAVLRGIPKISWKSVLVITFDFHEILRSYGEDLGHPCRPGLYLRHYGLHWWTDHWFGDGVPWMQIFTSKDHSLTVQSCVLLWLFDVSIIGQVLHLSHFHAYPRVGVCLQVRNCSQHYPGSHGSTKEQLLLQACAVRFLSWIRLSLWIP